MFVPLGRLTGRLVGLSGDVPGTSGAHGRSSKHARLRNGKQACGDASRHADRPERPWRPMVAAIVPAHTTTATKKIFATHSERGR